MKIQTAVLAAALCLGAAVARGQTPAYTACPAMVTVNGASTTTGVCTISLSAPAPVTPNSGGGRKYHRIILNQLAQCTRDPLAAQNQSGPGWFTMQPGVPEEYPIAGSSYVPQLQTYCSPPPGSTATITGSVEVN